MTGLVRKAILLTACGLLAAAAAYAATPCASCSQVPCAIVLVGHSAGNVTDPYGQFTVVVKDATNSPLNGATVSVDYSGCCPGIKLSNTQNGAGVSHVANSAIVTGLTDVTGTATFRVEGAAAGAASFLTGAVGCASISATVPLGTPVTLTNGIDHPTVFVSVADLAGTVGVAGVDATDLAFWISDKNAYTASTANFRQRSDFDFHLPAFNCSAVFNPSSGFGVNATDLSQWISIKNSHASDFNGPFPGTCP
jgi:hypothetical protein